MKKGFFYNVPKVFLALLCSVFFYEAPLIIDAQSPTPTQTKAPWSMELTPRNPGPNTAVRARAISYSINLNTSAISWYQDGVEVLSGVGKTEYSFTTGSSGEKTVVRAVVTTVNFGVTENIVVISPASVDILWAADTYTPPFYRGKALPTYGSVVRATALPVLFDKDGGRVADEDIIFTWKKERSTVQSKSGAGKKTFAYAAGFPKNKVAVGVVVATRDGKGSGEGSTFVPVIDPKIVLYEDRPLEGVRYEGSLGKNTLLPGNELSISLAPYFFSFPLRGMNTGRYEWFLDGKRVAPSVSGQNRMTFGRPGTGSGRAGINVSVSSREPYEILQEARENMVLSF